MKTTNHDELLNEIAGKQGAAERESFESELRAEILAYKFKELRKEKNLTQSQLAKNWAWKRGKFQRLRTVSLT